MATNSILLLKSVPDKGIYRLDSDFFADSTGRLWKNEGRKGERPLRLHYCEPSGEPSGPIWSCIDKVVVDGVDTPFCRFDRSTWQWEIPA